METMTAQQMAQHYGLKSSTALNKMLAKCGVLIDTAKGYVLAEELRGKGYTTIVDRYFFLPSGIKAKEKKAVWTESGQAYLHQRLGKLGIVPMGEQRSLF